MHNQIFGAVLFLDVSARMFLEEISIGISRLITEEQPSPMFWVSESIQGPKNKKRKSWVGVFFYLNSDIHFLLALDLELQVLEISDSKSWFSGLQSGPERYYQFTCFSGLQTELPELHLQFPTILRFPHNIFIRLPSFHNRVRQFPK